VGTRLSIIFALFCLCHVLTRRGTRQLGCRRKNVPEIALFLREFHGYFLFLVPMLGVHVDDPAFPFFLGEAIHEKNHLALLDSRR
jgi:hypothetical protein